MKKTPQKETKIFITNRNHSIDKNDLLTQRDTSIGRIHNKTNKKHLVTTCRKPIILKANLPAVFDIDKLKIIRRNDRNDYGILSDKHKVIMKTSLTSNEINNLFTEPNYATHDFCEKSIRELSSDTRINTLNNKKNTVVPFLSKNYKEKSKTSTNINYFNSTNDSVLIKQSEKLKNSFIESIFSKSLYQTKNKDNSISKKNSSTIHEYNEKESERLKRKKELETYNTIMDISLHKESLAFVRPLKQINIKNFKKYNLDLKNIKRIITITSPSKVEQTILKNTNTYEKPYRLEDLITISIVKSNSKSRIKKVFSVVNFEVILIKEILMNKKTNIVEIKDNLSIWRSKMKNSEKFVKIHQEFINQPESYLSILTEYLKGFSLQDLIINVGCLNEETLIQISKSIIESLLNFQQIFGKDYRDFCPCDIVFDKNGNLKMVPYILKLAVGAEIESETKKELKCRCHEYFHRKNILIHININTNSTNDSQSQNFSNNNIFRKTNSEETNKFPSNHFNLGFIILICLLGGNRVSTMKALINTSYNELMNSKVCCLYHYLLLIDESNNKGKKFKLSSFINETIISKELISLLCELLSFENKSNDLKSIRSNPWFRTSSVSKIHIKELIKIVKDIKRPMLMIKNASQINNFIDSFGIILTNIKEYDNSFIGKLLDPKENVRNMIDQRKHVIKHVSKELGSNFNDFSERIIKSISEFNKTFNFS